MVITLTRIHAVIAIPFHFISGGLLDGPRIFSGHTRFATSSIANMNGTHPHQWGALRTVPNRDFHCILE
jgi:hypothetical protein